MKINEFIKKNLKENMKKRTTDEHNHLAALVYVQAKRKEIEKEVESRYTKRIEYLVGANNELMQELEHWENEIITVSKESTLEEVKNEAIATTR